MRFRGIGQQEGSHVGVSETAARCLPVGRLVGLVAYHAQMGGNRSLGHDPQAAVHLAEFTSLDTADDADRPWRGFALPNSAQDTRFGPCTEALWNLDTKTPFAAVARGPHLWLRVRRFRRELQVRATGLLDVQVIIYLRTRSGFQYHHARRNRGKAVSDLDRGCRRRALEAALRWIRPEVDEQVMDDADDLRLREFRAKVAFLGKQVFLNQTHNFLQLGEGRPAAEVALRWRGGFVRFSRARWRARRKIDYEIAVRQCLRRPRKRDCKPFQDATGKLHLFRRQLVQRGQAHARHSQ